MDKKTLMPFVGELKEVALERLTAASALLDLARAIETAMDDPRNTKNAEYLSMNILYLLQQYDAVREMNITKTDGKERSTLNVLKNIIYMDATNNEDGDGEYKSRQ